MILPLTESLLACAEDGLKSRGFGEEVYLAPLREKLDRLNKSLDQPLIRDMIDSFC